MAIVGINVVDVMRGAAIGGAASLALNNLNTSGALKVAGALPNPNIKVYSTPQKYGTGGSGLVYGTQSLDPVLVSEIRLNNILLSMPVIQVKGRNIVKTTPNVSGDFEVNEVVGTGNWDVRIFGWVVNSFGGVQVRDFPFDQLETQISLFRNKIVDVSSEYLRRFDIHRMVIKDIDFNNEGGSENAYPYTINAISDNDIELELK